ncbi:MAG: helix-turn-helix domain-containing protein [Thiobacillaceae bacterium]|jgi:hypothetical protein|nr:helix-turn-helix domain-containing protein [Thiobacillaceae bacterium]
MPTLREILVVICRHAEAHHDGSIGEQCAREWEAMIRKSWPGERVYIAPPDSRRDPERAEKIREAAKRLPTGVTAERFGVSRSYVHRILKK